MSIMYCRKCSAPLLDTAHFCSTCGDSLSPQNDHPTLLTPLPIPGVSSSAENMTIEADVANYKTSALPAEVVEPPSENKDWKTSDLVAENTTDAPDDMNYKTINMENENEKVTSEIIDYKTGYIVDENATVESAHVNGATSASVSEQNEKSSPLNKNSYEGIAGVDDDTFQVSALNERNDDYATYDAYAAYSPGQREQVERSLLAEVPTALLKEDEADRTLTVPGLLAQLHPAPNSVRADHQQAEVSRGEHQQQSILRADHRQPAEPQQAFSAHIQPPRPAAIVSRGSGQQNFLFARRYFFIGTSVILLISFVILLTTYSYILKAKSAQTASLTANASNAFPGGSIVISGTNFIPGGVVTIKADGVLLVYNAVQPASYTMADLALSFRNASQDAGQQPIVQADGTFETTLTVPSNWSTGNHELVADEQISGKTVSAKIVVVVYARAVTPTPVIPTPTPQPKPTPIPTAIPSPTPTPIIVPTPTPTTYIAQLPCLYVSANALNFNVAAGSSPAPQTIMLINKCGAGTWSARSDTAWLAANAPGNSNTIAAHGTINVSITASSANLAANSYTGHIVFSAGSSQASVTITLTITQPLTACIKVNPTSLSFSSAAPQNPVPQTLLVTNCGSAGTVTAIVSSSYTIRALPTANGAQTTPLPTSHNATSWLTASPGGVLAQAGTLSINVDVNRTTSNLAPGIYTSSIAITVKTKDGKTDTYMVNVTFTLHPAS